MTQICISLPYSNALRNQFYLSYPEQIMIYVITPFAYSCAVFNIIFLLKGKNRAEPPADILLFVSIFGIIRVSDYLATTIYNNIYPPSQNQPIPPSYEGFCAATGFINVLCQMAGFVYNVVFCLYYLIKIKNPLKSWIKDHRQLHIISILIIIIITITLYLTGLVGISFVGLCGFRIGEGILYLDIVLTVIYFVVMVTSSVFFVKYLKSISKYQNTNKIYFRFYFKYLIISSSLHLVQLLSLLITTIRCYQDNVDTVFQVFSTINNLSRIVTPIMVFIVLMNHPQAKFSSLLKYLTQCLNLKKKEQQQDSFYSDLLTTKRTSIMIQLRELNKQNYQKGDYMSQLKNKTKACLFNTILGCIYLNQNQNLTSQQQQPKLKSKKEVQKQYFNESTLIINQQQEQYPYISSFIPDQPNRQSNLIINAQEEIDFKKQERLLENMSIKLDDIRYSSVNQINRSNSQIYGWNFKEKYQFILTESVVEGYKNLFIQNLPTINLKFIAFARSVFKNLQFNDKIFDLHKKMIPIKNQKNILDNVSTDGGRSGQFFFFNYDNTFIIKTITSNQLKVLYQRIQSYYNYFIRNPNSLIVKILGIYKVINMETQQQISFMLMSNILKNIPKKYVSRSYDMKGSTHQRQVLKSYQLSQQKQIKQTLKDLDFQNLQGRIHISLEDCSKIKNVLEQDCMFLYSQGLIDYSLIVLKIELDKLLEQNEINLNDMKIFRSTKQRGVGYIFGVIDYLETWNIRKKGQKWYKSVWNKTQNISSQDPKFYAQRFMKNLVQIIF